MKLSTLEHKSSNSKPIKKFFTGILIAIASTIPVAIFSHSSQAQTQKGFFCDNNSGIPTTIYRNAQGFSEPWIKWVSEYFSESQWTPLARCEAVSERLEKYRQEGKLKYVTLGVENDRQIICVASRDKGPCEGIVYTLKPGQDGIAALNNLFAWGSGQQNLQSSYESPSIPYINVGDRLNEPNN